MDAQADEGDAMVFAYREGNETAAAETDERIQSFGDEIEETAGDLGVSSCVQTPVPQGGY